MKLLKIIYSLFIVFIVLVALLLIISVLPITGNYKVLTVLSGSMEPAIKTGSVVVVKPEQKYNIGDVITFGSSGRNEEPITHRIYDMKVEDSRIFYVTKGDANNAADRSEITRNQIIGKVILSVPHMGYAVDFAKKPLGFALIIIVPAIFIIYDEGVKIWKEIKKGRARVAK